jgi:histone H3/H4
MADDGEEKGEKAQDHRLLPIANISRIMRKGTSGGCATPFFRARACPPEPVSVCSCVMPPIFACAVLPEQAKMAKDARECVQECASEFIQFITSDVADRLREDQRKTVTGQDLLDSMKVTCLRAALLRAEGGLRCADGRVEYGPSRDRAMSSSCACGTGAPGAHLRAFSSAYRSPCPIGRSDWWIRADSTAGRLRVWAQLHVDGPDGGAVHRRCSSTSTKPTSRSTSSATTQ